MGGKKPRGSEPARGSSFSCRSRRGGDFRSLSQELVAGGSERVVPEVQEFSLFSCLGVTEIAPWLSDDNNISDQHRTNISDLKLSDAAKQLESSSIYGNGGQFESRIQDLEEITRKMEQKIKNLEGKQKEKESFSTRSLSSGSFTDLKDVKEINESKDTKAGGMNIERFRTLEGRQAFQQSKFSSLDIVFGGSSSSIWSKGCKKLRALLLSADDPIESGASAIKESPSPGFGYAQESKMKTAFAADEEREDDSSKLRLGTNGDGSHLSDKSNAYIKESRNLSEELQSAVDSGHFSKAGSTGSVAPTDELEGRDTSKNEPTDEDNVQLMKTDFDKEDRIRSVGCNVKKIEKGKPSIQECLHQQIEVLVENLNSHRKKVQFQLDSFLKSSTSSNPTVLHQDYFNSEEDLVQYWTEIAVLNGRLDSLLMHYNGKGDISKKTDIESVENKILRGISEKTLNNLRNEKRNKGKDCVNSTVKNSGCDLSERNIESSNENKYSKSNCLNEKEKEHSGQGRGQRSDLSQSKSPSMDSQNRISKQRQLNMRSSSNIRTNANYGGNNSHGYEDVYNGDNSAVFYNTQGYPFGYNNHFISGNNYYGYPPSYTQQSDQKSARFNRQGGGGLGGGVYHSEAKVPASSQHNPTLDRRDRDRNEEESSAEGLDTANQALSTSTYAGPAGHSTYDMAGDSMPLRYDSPMSPYASYYVYVPVSGVANSGITTPKLELADEEIEGSRREDRSAAAQSREEPSGCEEYGE